MTGGLGLCKKAGSCHPYWEDTCPTSSAEDKKKKECHLGQRHHHVYPLPWSFFIIAIIIAMTKMLRTWISGRVVLHISS